MIVTPNAGHARLRSPFMATPKRDVIWPKASRSARVLLVEDDAETAAEVRCDLVARGYDVSVATTGPEGLSAVTESMFDLLIVDRMLPELDGLSVVSALRRE